MIIFIRSSRDPYRKIANDPQVESHCLRSSTEIKAFPTFFSGRNGNAIFSWSL